MRGLLAALTLALVSTPVGTSFVYAEGPQPGQGQTSGGNKPAAPAEISVVSGATGVTIYIAIADTSPGDPGTPDSEEPSGSASGPACTAFRASIGNASIAWAAEGLAQHPDSVPWFVQCDNGYAGVAWVPDSTPGDPAVEVVAGDPPVDPAMLAASVRDSIPLPPVALGASPDVGLVAVPTWYWIEGYDGQSLRGSRTLGGVTVEVEVAPVQYLWTFGDGTTLVADSTGRPYPEESEIQHTYEGASTAEGGYELRLAISFEARYRVNSGGWLPLDPLTQTYVRTYPVQQLQAVLTGG